MTDFHSLQSNETYTHTSFFVGYRFKASKDMTINSFFYESETSFEIRFLEVELGQVINDFDYSPNWDGTYTDMVTLVSIDPDEDNLPDDFYIIGITNSTELFNGSTSNGIINLTTTIDLEKDKNYAIAGAVNGDTHYKANGSSISIDGVEITGLYVHRNGFVNDRWPSSTKVSGIPNFSFNKRTEQYKNTYDMLPTTKTFNLQGDVDTTEIGSSIVLDGDFRIYCRFKITGTPNSWQYVYFLSNNNDTTSHEGFKLTIIGDNSNWSFGTIFGIYIMTNEIILSSLLNLETEVELIRTHGVSNQLFVNGVDYSHTFKIPATDTTSILTNTETGSFHTFRFSMDSYMYFFQGEIYKCFIEYGRSEPEPVLGCTDSNAFNYDASANTDDATCIDKVFGCTDVNASNYDNTANTDGGSCTEYIEIFTDEIVSSSILTLNTTSFTNGNSSVEITQTNFDDEYSNSLVYISKKWEINGIPENNFFLNIKIHPTNIIGMIYI